MSQLPITNPQTKSEPDEPREYQGPQRALELLRVVLKICEIRSIDIA
jgi:hypothetical protein